MKFEESSDVEKWLEQLVFLRKIVPLEPREVEPVVEEPIPEPIEEPDNHYLRIRVTRTDVENVENLVYYFKKFKQRFYLYFKTRRESIHLPLSMERQESPKTSNEE